MAHNGRLARIALPGAENMIETFLDGFAAALAGFYAGYRLGQWRLRWRCVSAHPRKMDEK